METCPQSPKPIGGGVRPLRSIRDLDGFHQRQEQEAIIELRKRAITRWLKQLPEARDVAKPRTMWTSFQSFGDVDDSVRAMQRGRESRDLDGYNLTELSEEVPVEDYEQKRLPSERDHPVQTPCTPFMRGGPSVQNRGHDRQLQRSVSDTTAIHHTTQRAQFSKKWSLKEASAVSEVLMEVDERPLKSIEEALLHRKSSRETSGSDAWSVLSEDAEGDILQNEDTAYGGSHSGSRKKPSGSYHQKYGNASPVFLPPDAQSMEPHTETQLRPMTPLELQELRGRQTEVSEGEWWLPNIFFRGFVGMVCNPGWIEEDAESPSSQERQEPPCPMHERVLRRLSHHRASGSKRRVIPHLPQRGKLYMRMQQAKRAQEIRDQEIVCELEHPFGMKAMIPSGSQTPQPLIPPEIRVMEYLPPSSVTDLSDFECYMGPMLTAFAQQSHVQHPAVGHCQNWLLEKLLCFLGGRPTIQS